MKVGHPEPALVSQAVSTKKGKLELQVTQMQRSELVSCSNRFTDGAVSSSRKNKESVQNISPNAADLDTDTESLIQDWWTQTTSYS